MPETANSLSLDRELAALAAHAFRCARRLGAGIEDAEDVSQEVMMLLVADASVVSRWRWTATVVRHRVARLGARRPAGAELPCDLLQHDPWSGRDRWLDVRSALLGLVPRAQQILRMSLSGYSERDIAASVGCSVKAVEKSLHKSRCRLRTLTG